MIKGRFGRLLPAIGLGLVMALVIGLAPQGYAGDGGQGRDSHEKKRDTDPHRVRSDKVREIVDTLEHGSSSSGGSSGGGYGNCAHC